MPLFPRTEAPFPRNIPQGDMENPHPHSRAPRARASSPPPPVLLCGGFLAPPAEITWGALPSSRLSCPPQASAGGVVTSGQPPASPASALPWEALNFCLLCSPASARPRGAAPPPRAYQPCQPTACPTQVQGPVLCPSSQPLSFLHPPSGPPTIMAEGATLTGARSENAVALTYRPQWWEAGVPPDAPPRCSPHLFGSRLVEQIWSLSTSLGRSGPPPH